MLLALIKLLMYMPYLLFKKREDLKNNKNGDPVLYGIYGIFGLPGTGKTLSLSRELQKIRKQYGDKVLITTNYYYKDQDFPFDDWKILLNDYDRPLVVAWDEIQNVFNSRDYLNFPLEILGVLTQVRKNNGIKIMYTSQRYNFVDKNFRELTYMFADAKTYLSRYTILKWYDSDDYKTRATTDSVDRKIRIKTQKVESYLHTEAIRNSYNHKQMLDNVRTKRYMSAKERSLKK